MKRIINNGELRSLTQADVPELDISGSSVPDFPEGLVVTRRLEVADTALIGLPRLAQGARLTWRGVTISADVALHPAQITAQRVKAERNAELRRVLLERMGYRRFVEETGAQTLDRDTDPGGPRRLLSIDFGEREKVILLHVRCPSTRSEYLLRVPPTVLTCRQAAAWIAHFDIPSDYQPLIET